MMAVAGLSLSLTDGAGHESFATLQTFAESLLRHRRSAASLEKPDLLLPDTIQRRRLL